MNSAYQSQDITELAKALLNVQRQLQPIPKDSENPFTKSWYASLRSVMAACRDALLDNGIWLCHYLVCGCVLHRKYKQGRFVAFRKKRQEYAEQAGRPES